MKTMTLVAKHLYFGLDPRRLRDAANRVLSRFTDDAKVPATLPLDALVEDFRLTAGASRAIVEQMVADGVLKPLSDNAARYAVTTRLREIAAARIVEPLARTQAQMLLAHCAELAQRFNRTATRNKYEIEAVAVHGSYMSRQADIAELSLAITGRRRAPGQKTLIGRATVPTEGTERIRELFERQNSFIEVRFFKQLIDIPRPFSVVFKADD
ncbi:MAG: hypothetical protein IT521_10060 [Burkholderiales bacterium]|nr:hypothetical protein [Burkholderiales bacterium]